MKSNNTSHTWIDFVYTNLKKKGRYKWRFLSEKSLLTPSFESETFRPRSSLFAAILSKQDLAIFMAPHGPAQFKRPVLWRTTLQRSPASCVEHSKSTQSTLPQSLYALKEFASHLLGPNAPATEPGFGFCQQHLKFPSSLTIKYYSDPMLRANFDAITQT